MFHPDSCVQQLAAEMYFASDVDIASCLSFARPGYQILSQELAVATG